MTHKTSKAAATTRVKSRMVGNPPDLDASDLAAIQTQNRVPKGIRKKIKARVRAIREWHLANDERVEPVWEVPEMGQDVFGW